MSNKSTYYIATNDGRKHYDTNDNRFYTFDWTPTLDTLEECEATIANNPDQFADCHIVNNNESI